MYNGKELQAYSGYYDYGARMYNSEVGRFFTVDRFSTKYYPLTPYQYAANNPIKYIDVNGDSISANSNLTKDQNKALTEFAATKAGKKELAKYAHEGQTIFGQTFNKSGKYDKKGINLNYSKSDRDNSNTGSYLTPNGSFNITIKLGKGEDFFNGNTVLNLIGDIAHETFLHAKSNTEDFLDDGDKNFSNISNEAKYSGMYWHYQHAQISYDQWNGKTDYENSYFSVMNQVTNQNGNTLNFRDLKFAAWGFSGSLIVVDKKTGKQQWKNK